MSQGNTNESNSTDNQAVDAPVTDLFDRLRQSRAEPAAGDETAVADNRESAQPGDDKPGTQDDIQTGASDTDAGTDSSAQAATMPPDARRALVSLLKNGVLLAAQKGKLFEGLCRYQAAIRQHLANVYLKLVLDEKAGVAFVAIRDEGDAKEGYNESEDNGEEGSVSLITRRTLSLYDTLLLLVLRKHYQERQSTGEQQIYIDIERIEAGLSPFLPLTNSMKTDRKKLVGALKKMLEKRILSMPRGSTDRFEITPVIRYVVNAAFLEKMLDTYQQLAREAGAADTVPAQQPATGASDEAMK